MTYDKKKGVTDADIALFQKAAKGVTPLRQHNKLEKKN